MNEAFEKILEKLEELQNNLLSQTEGDVSVQVGIINGVMYSKKIVQEVAEKYNGGWIPCSEKLPSGLDFVLYTRKDGEVDICSIEYFYDYLDKFTAWQPIPEPFKESD